MLAEINKNKPLYRFNLSKLANPTSDEKGIIVAARKDMKNKLM